MANKWKPYDIGDYDGFAGALAEALGGYWSDSAAEGNSPTGMDITHMAFQEYMQNQQNQFTQNMYAEDRAWQEEMYERYQSIGGQIDQMRQNGINPMMMFAGSGVNAPAVQSGQMPSSGSGSSPSGSGRAPIQGFQKAMSAIQAVLGMLSSGNSVAQGISQLVRNRTMNEKDVAQKSLYEQQAFKTRVEGEIAEIDKEFRRSYNEIHQQESKSRIGVNFSTFVKNLSQASVNESVVEVNGHKIDLLKAQKSLTDEQKDLVHSEVLLNGIKADQASLDYDLAVDMYQYELALRKSEAELAAARTETERSMAQQALANAEKTFSEAAINNKLIDIGYYEQQLEKEKQLTKKAKQETLTGYIRCASSTLRDVVSAGVEVVGTIASGGLSGAAKTAFSGLSSSSRPYSNTNFGDGYFGVFD